MYINFAKIGYCKQKGEFFLYGQYFHNEKQNKMSFLEVKITGKDKKVYHFCLS